MITLIELAPRVSVCPREGPKTPGATRFLRLMLVAFAALLSVEVLLASVTHLDCRQLVGKAPLVLLLAGTFSYCHWRRFPKLREITLLLLCSVVINDLLLLLVTTAGRAPSPLADVRLERIDSSLHLSTAAVVRWITRFPALSGCLTVIYHLLTVVVAFALLAPALSGNFDASRRYVFSVLIAGTITAVLFAACPAAGPWVGHKYRPTAGQSHVEVYLRLVKSARSIPLDFSEGGIVSFPSFHVVLAVLSAVALWDFRTARWIVLAVSTAICISTVTTGWHYFIDVIGGLAVAAIADAIAARALQTDLVSYS